MYYKPEGIALPCPLDHVALRPVYHTYEEAHIARLIDQGEPRQSAIPYNKEKALEGDYVLLTIIHDQTWAGTGGVPILSTGIWPDDEDWVEQKYDELRDGYAKEYVRARVELALERVGKDLQGEAEAVRKKQAERGEAGGQKRRPPLSANAGAVYELLKALPEHKAMTGKEIITALDEKEKIFIDQSTLTKSIIPALQPYGVRNKRGAGYYIVKE